MRQTVPVRRTIAFLHAHPDDEALLTGGTIARLAGQGHRVLIVTATDGGAGLVSPASAQDSDEVAVIRRAELAHSARALGAVGVTHLGYADSGLDGVGSSSTPGLAAAGGRVFAGVPVEEAASRVAEILHEERVACLVGYDAAGGYGHPDHLQVHRVARRAVDIAGTPLLLEASLPGEVFRTVGRAAQFGSRLVPAIPGAAIRSWTTAYRRRRELTHRIDVRPVLAAKHEALMAHTSQASGGLRTIDLLLRLPGPLFEVVAGTEWFVGPANPLSRWYRHPLQSLPPTPPGAPA